MKGEQVQRRGREERSTINILLVPKVELGSSSWTLQYGGESREVTNRIRSLKEGESASHCQLQ